VRLAITVVTGLTWAVRSMQAILFDPDYWNPLTAADFFGTRDIPQTADIRVYWNKTGMSAGGPTFLERPSGALLEMAGQNLAAQMSLFGSSDPVSWVIAHAGNTQDGLASIHIAAPQLTRNGRVVGWQQAVAI